MWTDPIVEEVRHARAEYAAELNDDLAAIVQDLKEQQDRSQRPIVRLRPREPLSSPRNHAPDHVLSR